ncbi:type I-E CRISPR-associated protein Cas6/Cse3/CasE [Sessilibacter sp. MAH4]
MFLSKFSLKTPLQQHQLHLILSQQVYGLHRLLKQAFNDSFYLFREEVIQSVGNNSQRLYYVLSTEQPKPNNDVFDVETKRFEPHLLVDQQLEFRLRVNPVVARKTPGKKHSPRHDVVMDAQRQHLMNLLNITDAFSVKHIKKSELKKRVLTEVTGYTPRDLDSELKTATENALKAWLDNKAKKHGFECLSFQADGYQWQSLPEKGRGAGFSTVDYQGILKVTEPQAFLAQLYKGFGPSKAFGCGLMMVRPAW